LRSLNREVGGGGELNAARDLFRVAALQGGDVRVALEWRHRDIAKDLLATAAGQQMLSEREPVIVAGDEADEHDGFGAVVEQPVKRFERALPIVRKQMIAEFEIR
jgi:hypothetical protein